MKCQILFYRKNKKKIYIISLLSAEFDNSMLSVKLDTTVSRLAVGYDSPIAFSGFSRQQIYDIFLIIPREKYGLTFHANCLFQRQFA